MTTQVNGTSGITFSDSSVQNTAAIGFRNRIINGAMMIDQRNAGASVTGNASTQPFCLDRWQTQSSVSSKFTVQQNAGSVTTPAGFPKYLGATSSAATSLSATDYYCVVQKIEGYNISDLAWGTASAATVTLSFWVRSSLTGTFGGSIQNDGQGRSYPFTYTISAANTWELKSVTIPGDTGGTWGTTTGIGMFVWFGLGVGSTYSGSAGSWSSGFYLGATGATSVVGTNGATLYITGVQLEKGSVATPFEVRQYGTELALCQRYYETSYDYGTAVGTATHTGDYLSIAYSASINRPTWAVMFKQTKRATPTVTLYSCNNGATGNVGGPSGANYTGTTADVGLQGFNAFQNQTTATSNGDYYLQYGASAEL